MKAVISNRIYFKPEDSAELKKLNDILTYRIVSKFGTGKKAAQKVEFIRNLKTHPGGLISIPQGRIDLIGDRGIIDKRTDEIVPFPLPKAELFPEQKKVYDEVTGSCFINAKVGWGKTFTALHLARKLAQKTLIVTHTVMLKDQWCEEIRNLYGIEPGVITADTFDIEDHCIVVGNIQTVIKHLTEIQKVFGTLILDEAHHVPADTFATLVDGMYSKYKIALSGTMLRKDGKHIIFKDYFGSHIIKPPTSNTLEPKVKIVKTNVYLPPDEHWSKKINKLLYDQEYQSFIASMALKYIEQGHKVLIVAERVEFLKAIQELIGEETCVLITGKAGSTNERDYEERKALIEQVNSGQKSCIAGSKQIFSEGISVNILSLLILAAPSSNTIFLEQVIGRIMRKHPNKLDPIVVDINYKSPVEKKQDAARLAFYVAQGWDVEFVS